VIKKESFFDPFFDPPKTPFLPYPQGV